MIYLGVELRQIKPVKRCADCDDVNTLWREIQILCAPNPGRNKIIESKKLPYNLLNLVKSSISIQITSFHICYFIFGLTHYQSHSTWSLSPEGKVLMHSIGNVRLFYLLRTAVYTSHFGEMLSKTHGPLPSSATNVH